MIKDMRERRGMTQLELAQKCGVTQPYISMLENGKRTNLKISLIVKLAAALDVTVAQIVEVYGCENRENIA